MITQEVWAELGYGPTLAHATIMDDGYRHLTHIPATHSHLCVHLCNLFLNVKHRLVHERMCLYTWGQIERNIPAYYIG